MIELLLVADRLLEAGDLDRAERIYRQVADADPRNAIAVVGLARVAEAHGAHAAAIALAGRALEIDPEDEVAKRLARREAARAVEAAPVPEARATAAGRRSILSRLKQLLGLGR